MPEEAECSTEDSVSLVKKSCEDVGVFVSDGDDAAIIDVESAEDNGKRKSQNRRRQPIMEGRR